MCWRLWCAKYERKPSACRRTACSAQRTRFGWNLVEHQRQQQVAPGPIERLANRAAGGIISPEQTLLRRAVPEGNVAQPA